MLGLRGKWHLKSGKWFTRFVILETNQHDLNRGIAALVFYSDPAVCGGHLCVSLPVSIGALVL
jgi:hypothetical protein